MLNNNMTSQWAVSTLRRIVSDLIPFQERRTIPSDVIESFVVSLELVYRELLAKESIEGMTSAENEGCECVRLSLDIMLANMSELNRMNELQCAQTEPIRDGRIGHPVSAVNSCPCYWSTDLVFLKLPICWESLLAP